MSELGTRPTDLPDWATTPTEHAEGTAVDPAKAVIKPTLAYQRAGWPLGKPVRQYMNWFMRRVSEWLEYFEESSPRSFTTLEEGVAATSAGGRFWVDSTDLTNAPGSANGTPLAHGGNVNAVCCDGRYVYYGGATGTSSKRLRKAGRTLPSALLSIDTGETVNGVCTDGMYVYTAGAGGLANSWNCADLTSASAGYNHGDVINGLSCNGKRVAIGGVAGTGGYELRVLEADLSHVWDATVGATVNAVAIDGELIFAGGEVSGGYEVRRYEYDGTHSASFAHGATVNAIATDGEHVFIGGEVGTGTKHIRCLSRALGTDGEIWSVAVAGTITAVAVDDRYLYAGRAGAIYCFHKLTGGLVWSTSQDSVTSLASDGDAVFYGAAGSEDEVGRLRRPGGLKLFQRVATDDRYRRPFPNLAVPSE